MCSKNLVTGNIYPSKIYIEKTQKKTKIFCLYYALIEKQCQL